MTAKLSLITEKNFIHPDAPTRYERRRCSMGVKCKTYAQTARWGEPEVAKVRETKEAIGVAEGGAPIVLCGLCEKAWSASGMGIHEFTGLNKPGRTTSYFLFGLRDVRKSRGLTQEGLGALVRREGVSCSQETIAAAERSGDRRRRVSTKMAGKLARALGVSANDLRGE